jgi:uncharacterized RDD family membrane protein YckC
MQPNSFNANYSKPDYSISTPENVDLHLELAGVGNRALSCLVDTALAFAFTTLIILSTWLAIVLIGVAPLTEWLRSVLILGVAAIGILLTFIVYFGYYIYFEGRWHGTTPGKKVAHIRVIEESGQPVSWASVITRNLLRVFDFGFVFIGLLPMVIDSRERRFGDMLAGTLVIRERSSEISKDKISKDIDMLSQVPVERSTIDVGKITPREYEVLMSFLRRRKLLSQNFRPVVASKIAEHFKSKLGTPTNNDFETDSAEQFLEKLYTAYQSRAEI